MENQKPLNSKTGSPNRAMSPLQMIRGFTCLLVFVSTAFVMLIFCGFLSAFGLRFFSIHYSRKVTSFFFSSWLALWPLLFEKINGTKVIFSGERVPRRERVLLIANHRTEVDWMYLWDLALRKGCLGYIKYILKRSLMKLPIFGWGFYILEFISVERKWEVDESNLHQMLSTFKDPRDPLWLAVFPEGTDFTEQKCNRSKKYASENGLPVLNNVLLPKTKGFCACLEDLRDSLDAVYDITIGYKPRCPSFLDNVFGTDPSEVHIHVRRIPVKDIPQPEDEVASWLMDAFNLKDKLLGDFYSLGHFPQPVAEGHLSTVRCVVNFIAVILLTITCIFFIFSAMWCKMYVSLACVALASSTYFDIRPAPFFGYAKAKAS